MSETVEREALHATVKTTQEEIDRMRLTHQVDQMDGRIEEVLRLVQKHAATYDRLLGVEADMLGSLPLRMLARCWNDFLTLRELIHTSIQIADSIIAIGVMRESVGRPLPPEVPREALAVAFRLEEIKVKALEQFDPRNPPFVYISPAAYLRSCWAIFWNAFRHPLRSTTIDLTTGKVVN